MDRKTQWFVDAITLAIKDEPDNVALVIGSAKLPASTLDTIHYWQTAHFLGHIIVKSNTETANALANSNLSGRVNGNLLVIPGDGGWKDGSKERNLLASQCLLIIGVSMPNDEDLVTAIAEVRNYNYPTFWALSDKPDASIKQAVRSRKAVVALADTEQLVKALIPGIQASKSALSDTFVSKGFAFMGPSVKLDDEKSEAIRILAIDGGGIRGVIPALILQKIEEGIKPKQLTDVFHIIAGTSTGGILALGLAAPQEASQAIQKNTAAQLANLYSAEGQRIFPPTANRHGWWVKLLAGILRFMPLKQSRDLGTALWAVFTQPYSSDGIDAVLKKYFTYENGTDIKLSEALCHVLITSYDLKARRNSIFRKDQVALDDQDPPMRLVARATSAAPTFFKPLAMSLNGPQGEQDLIDGGLMANNPAFCAFAEARRIFGQRDCILVSIGTGTKFRPIDVKRVNRWKTGEWAETIITTMFDAGSESINENLDWLLPDSNGMRKYYRLQVHLDEVDDSIDAAQNVSNLAARTNNAIDHELKRDLDQLIEFLKSV